MTMNVFGKSMHFHARGIFQKILAAFIYLYITLYIYVSKDKGILETLIGLCK